MWKYFLTQIVSALHFKCPSSKQSKTFLMIHPLWLKTKITKENISLYLKNPSIVIVRQFLRGSPDYI